MMVRRAASRQPHDWEDQTVPKEYKGVEAQMREMYLNEYPRLTKKEDEIALFQQVIEIARKESLRQWEFFAEGMIAYFEGDKRKSLQLFEQSISLDPEFAYPWNGKGLVLRAQKKNDEALAAYDQAIDLDPKFAYPWQGKGNALGEQKKFDEAIAAYKEAIDLDPKYSSPWHGKGTVLEEQKKFDEALAAFEQAIALNPELAEPWNGKGNVLFDQNKFNEALAAYNQAVALDSKVACAWNGKGVVLKKLKRYDEALVAYKKAIELDDSIWYHFSNAGLLVEENAINKEDALVFFREAAKREPAKEYEPLVRMWIQRLESELKQAQTADQPATADATTVGSDFYSDLLQSGLLDCAHKELADLKKNLSQAYRPGSRTGKNNTLFVLRDWNSFTPILGKRFRPPEPSRPSAMLGGGYFFTWKEHGVAVDPGIDFVTQLYNKKLGIADVNSIVVTHCHLDHFHDVEPLIDLNYRFNKNAKELDPRHVFRQLQFFLSTNADEKYSNWAHRTHCCAQTLHLEDKTEFDVSTNIRVLAAGVFHEDIVSKGDAIGLIFSLKDDDHTEHLRIGITSDTRWDPTLPEKFKGCHVLIAHLGTVEDQTDFANKKNLEKHLGLRGCFDLMAAVKPRLFIVGEFGEELFMLRMKILKVLHKYRPEGTIVLAGDSNLAISLEPKLQIHCSHPNCDGSLIPLDQIKPVSGDDMLFRYYCDEHSVEEKKEK